MVFKCLILATVLAVSNAGYLGAPAAVGYAAPAAVGYAAPAYGHALATPAITAQQSNILRTPGNLGQISTYSKSINTPYSSVHKSDVRVSNDALAYPAAHAGYAVHEMPSYAAPAYASPIVHAAPGYPAHGYAAPVVKAAVPAMAGYAAPTFAAPAYAAPVVKVTAPVVAGHGLLGVAYSAAPAVAHMTYSNGLGIHYTY